MKAVGLGMQVKETIAEGIRPNNSDNEAQRSEDE